jgi:hypothetical protein
VGGTRALFLLFAIQPPIQKYIAYYHEDRTHIALEKTTPGRRPVEPVLTEPCQLLALPRIGGLHHLPSAADAGCETTSDPTTGRPKGTGPIPSNGLACLLARTCLWLFYFFSQHWRESK